VLELADAGEGTTFRIELPLERATARAAPRYRARNPQPSFA